MSAYRRRRVVRPNQITAEAFRLYLQVEDDRLAIRFINTIDLHVAPDNQNAYKAYFNLERVVQKLDNEKQYEGIFRVLEDGTERYKRMIFSYIDRESKLLSLIQMDVTDLWKNQAEHEAALSAALIAAKQASSAKTNFLSRMKKAVIFFFIEAIPPYVRARCPHTPRRPCRTRPRASDQQAPDPSDTAQSARHKAPRPRI